LPPGWQASKSEQQQDESDKGSSSPDIEKEPPSPDVEKEPTESAEDDCYGPALPPDMVEQPASSGRDKDEEPDDDITVGPVPPSTSETAEEYEYRLFKLRREKEEEEEILKRKRKREEWMTELPSKLSKSYGLGPRTFKKHDSGAGGDTTEWTETPEERMLKKPADSKDDEKILIHKAATERDKKFDVEVERMNAKRPKESLVELHTKKKKHEQEEAKKGGKSERVPFDREKDLKTVNLKSASERHSTLDKARLLDTRFGHGSNQKYL